MEFQVEGIYNPETNTAIVTHAGNPASREDLDKAFQVHKETWGEFDHRVYVISDIRGVAKADYNRVSYHVGRMKKLRREKAAFTVMVADNVASRFTAKLYEFVTGDKIEVAQTLEQALEIIRAVQEHKGIIPKY